MTESNAGKTPRVLFVANVTKEHILKFHIPTIKLLVDSGWMVDVASGGADEVPYCHRHIVLPIDRSPFKGNIFKGIRQLKKEIAANNYDLVFCHTEVGGIVARLAAKSFRKKGLKVVKLDHGFYFYKGASLLTWAIHLPVDKLLSKFTDTFITINQEDHRFASRHFNYCKNYIIDGIGVDPSRFTIVDREKTREAYRKELGIPQDAVVFIYLAELIKNKNQTFLMDALKLVLEKRKDAYLVLAGTDHTNGEFEKYAQSIGITENVKFLGWRNDANNLYAMSDICTASSIREGFGLNLVEAIYCGVPIIASNNRGHATIVRDGETGYLIKQGDVKRFADKMLSLANNRTLQKQFAENADKDKAKYSSEVITNRIKSILEKEL